MRYCFEGIIPSCPISAGREAAYWLLAASMAWRLGVLIVNEAIVKGGQSLGLLRVVIYIVGRSRLRWKHHFTNRNSLRVNTRNG